MPLIWLILFSGSFCRISEIPAELIIVFFFNINKMNIYAADFILCVIAEIAGINAVSPAGRKDGDTAVRIRHCPIKPVASLSLVSGIGFEIFLQQIAEQIVVEVDAPWLYGQPGCRCRVPA